MAPMRGGYGGLALNATRLYSLGAMFARAPVETRLLRPIVFARPIRQVSPPSWAGHIPFAFWIVEALSPRVLVELGTHTGVSYSAFVQAAQQLRLDTACYAIDTWKGDAQTGAYGEDVFDEWSAFHDRQFGGASRLVRSTFDEARPHFAPESIDLLHIDGLHTYDAVRHDFETWLPALSRRAVVLVHDVNVREGDSGAWRYWDELKARYRSFTFMHGNGLGVLAVGPAAADDVAWLTSLGSASHEADDVRRIFAGIGEVWSTRITLEQVRQARASADARARAAEAAALAATATAAAQAASGAELADAEQRQAAHAAAAHQSSEALAIALEQLDSTRRALEALRTESAARMEQAAEDRERSEAETGRLKDAITIAQIEDRCRDEARTLAVLRVQPPGPVVPPVSLAGKVRQRLRWSGLNPSRIRRHPIDASRALLVQGHPSVRRAIGLLGSSGVFDEAYYASHEQVAGLSSVRLREHFVRHGDRAGLSPHRLFDPGWYRRENPDLPADARPLFHYLRYGAGEGRSPHPLFDTELYLARIGTPLKPGTSPLSHFLFEGAARGLSPHTLFETAHYVRQHPAVGVAGRAPILHYLETAHREQLDPHPLFSTRYYVATNPDVTSMNPLVHFLVYGAAEERSPHPLFDVRFYLQQRPDIRGSRMNPLHHYLYAAGFEDVDPHPLFDTDFYFEQAPILREKGINPLVHFVEGGWRLGFRPNRWFDPLWYATENAQALTGLNPLVHYAAYGWREGRDPSPGFSLSDYLEAHPDVEGAGLDPLTHAIRGWRQGARPARPRTTPTHAPARVFSVSGHAAAGVPTIVIVSHVAPWPVRAGNEYRVHRVLEHLKRQGYRLVLILAPIPSEPPSPDAFDWAVAAYDNVVLCEPGGTIRYALRTCPDVLARLQGQLVPPAPLELAGTPFAETDRAFCHDTVCAVSQALTKALGRVAVMAEYIFMTRSLQALDSDTLKIIDTHDVFSQKARSVLAFGIADVEMAPAEEARRLNRADMVMAIHEPDAAAFRTLAPDRDVFVSGVDATVCESRPWPAEPVALIAGSGNALNLTSMRDFLRYGWPAVRERMPDARLRVAGNIGRAVPPGVAGVEVLGHVRDLAEEYAGARVAINPTVAGTGLKIKTIEALAHLTPIVGWPHNRDGLSPRVIGFVREAQNWRAFSDAICDALSAAQCPFDAAAIAVIQDELSASRVYKALDARLRRFFAGTGTPAGPAS